MISVPRTENTIFTPEQLLLEALESRWNNYRLQLKRCRVEFSNEAVHDMRVALRRLLSLIQLLNSFAPRPSLRKLSRTLKNQLDEFDDLRDTQVMLAEISATILELPQLQKPQQHLQRTENKLLKALSKTIKKIDLKEVTRRVRKTRKTLKEESQDDMVTPILHSVDDAFLITKQRYDRIDPAQPGTIHRVRVAFKKFRYTVEIIHPLLMHFPEMNFKHMNDYQSWMGEIQDLEIFMQTLADFSQNNSTLDLESVHGYYEMCHNKAMSAYLDNKDMLINFWRPSAEQPFPWDETK